MYRSWNEGKERVTIQTPQMDEIGDHPHVLEEEKQKHRDDPRVSVEHKRRPWDQIDVIVPQFSRCTRFMGQVARKVP